MSHADIVNQWFQDRLRGGPLARDTEAYNQASNAIADLIERLDASRPPEGGAARDAVAAGPLAAALDPEAPSSAVPAATSPLPGEET